MQRTIIAFKLSYTMDLVQSRYNARWYWKLTGSYNPEDYIKDVERSGASYEVPCCEEYFRTEEEVAQFAKCLRADYQIRFAYHSNNRIEIYLNYLKFYLIKLLIQLDSQK